MCVEVYVCRYKHFQCYALIEMVITNISYNI